MICPLTDNFRAVIARSCSMLNEIGMTDASMVLMFFASLDYSDLKTAQAQAAGYIRSKERRREKRKAQIGHGRL